MIEDPPSAPGAPEGRRGSRSHRERVRFLDAARSPSAVVFAPRREVCRDRPRAARDFYPLRPPPPMLFLGPPGIPLFSRSRFADLRNASIAARVNPSPARIINAGIIIRRSTAERSPDCPREFAIVRAEIEPARVQTARRAVYLSE